MKKKINLKYIIFLAIFGLVGGYFTALYSIEMLTPESLEQSLAQVGSIEALIAITVAQTLMYSVALGLIGRALARKIGLWRELSFEAKPITSAIISSILGGAVFILGDLFIFGSMIDVVKQSYTLKPTLNYIIASITYGGVVEEVMLRLFFMSLIAFILMKLSKGDKPTDSQLVIANILSAMLFAAGHLPATIMTIGITPIIIIRCFVMNGAFGLIFGRLYRKYGIQYAMLAHAGVHIVSKLVWILFV